MTKRPKKQRPPKKILLDYEEKMSLDYAAAYLAQIAQKLKEDGSITIQQGDQEVTITPTDRVELELSLEQRGGKFEFEIELEWNENDASYDQGPLQIK